MKKVFKYLIYILPAALYFSYFPLISFGKNETMNFEISLSLIWLVLFDLAVAVLVVPQKTYWQMVKRFWLWLLFPAWLTLSLIWSLNPIRGLLTVGILWLIYFAVSGIYYLRNLFDSDFRAKFWKIFYTTTIIICIWCFVQCLLDLAGIGREYTLMCAGCTYRMFGFPHPNGFAIEPQFMGNLLLAPALTLAYFNIKDSKASHLAKSARSAHVVRQLPRFLPRLLLFAVLATLFLTFSRGAIYAFVVAMVSMSAFFITKEKKTARKPLVKSISLVWGIIVIAFAFTLNLQGIMASVSPTTDTYKSGVAKVLNHLSLGIIDIDATKQADPDAPKPAADSPDSESSALSSTEPQATESPEEAIFDGYVEESTNARVYLTNSGIASWQQSPSTILFGVGLGGAGQALYQNDFIIAPKEIVQNQYASLLLESGLVGITLFILTLILIIRIVLKIRSSIITFSLLLAYAITLCFFSGLANALQIYLMPPVVAILAPRKPKLKNSK